MSPLVGTLLSGRYRLDAQIGTGGMSTVYRAFDTTLERTVAVKVMHREIASDSDQLERFRREARAVAQFSHPHIVGVIDAGEDDGRPYIVFEYVEGETLKDRIRRSGMLPVDEALAYAIEITRALGAAHSRGIVHRDIKPQNVLIDEEGMAKVTDFGIARSLDEEGLTADGRVLGTTDYVSPEQALGHPVNGQSDIYSLGVVVYEMLAGDVPFHGENQVAVAMKHVREDIPDIVRLRPEVTASVAAVLDRMTCKALERRYADAVVLEDDLEDALAHEAARSGRTTGEATAVLRTLPPGAARSVPLRLRYRRPLLAALLIALVLAAVVTVLLIGNGNPVEIGTGAPRGKAPAGTRNVSVARSSAMDYDPPPLGDANEHHDEVPRAVDGDPATAWTTEHYSGNVIAGAHGPKGGVGIYVDAKPSVVATALRIQTPAPGWKATIYAAPAGAVPPTVKDWTPVAPNTTISRSKQDIKLDTNSQPYRYYLVWITNLASDADDVEIGELSLFKSA
jgi:tRNA A-37 threonylcarbamoyl transferase component Bud32